MVVFPRHERVRKREREERNESVKGGSCEQVSQRKFSESERFLAIESIKKKAADKAHLGQLIDVIVSANWRCRAPSTAQSYQRANQRRMEWMKGMGMDSGPEALILYLANQTEFVGASSLATTSAAYKLVNGSLGEAFNQIIADIVNARRREEALVRKPPKILSEKEIDQRPYS
uniref:Uncharacterized protein n=1 Tax=Caenorhabditis japonica TaxID=281687 RepID=A0A8R1DVN8_CAEJA